MTEWRIGTFGMATRGGGSLITQCLTDGVFAIHDGVTLSHVITGMRIGSFRDVCEAAACCDSIRKLADWLSSDHGEKPASVMAAKAAIIREVKEHGGWVAATPDLWG